MRQRYLKIWAKLQKSGILQHWTQQNSNFNDEASQEDEPRGEDIAEKEDSQ